MRGLFLKSRIQLFSKNDLKQYLTDNGLANIKDEEPKETAETPTEEVQPDEQPAE